MDDLTRVPAEAAAGAEPDDIQFLKHVQRIGELGCWIWDAATQRITWSDQLYRIYGFEPGAVTPSFELFLEAPADGSKKRTFELRCDASPSQPKAISCSGTLEA